MPTFLVWDPLADECGDYSFEADDAEDAADEYMAKGEENSWWVGGDEPPDELWACEVRGAHGNEPTVVVDVTTEYERSFYTYARVAKP
jgi:hypothetical protein